MAQTEKKQQMSTAEHLERLRKIGVKVHIPPKGSQSGVEFLSHRPSHHGKTSSMKPTKGPLAGLILTIAFSLSAQAKVGWSYEQCIRVWGQPTDHITLTGCPEPDEIRPLFIFHYKDRYVAVEIHNNRVTKETVIDSDKF